MGKACPSPPNFRLRNLSYDPRLSLETQKGLQSNLASEDPAIDSGLKAVSLLVAHHTALAASFEGSILLCNDYRHASPPARSESWGVVDVQVDFTGLAIIRPHLHKTGYGSVPHRWGRSIRALAMSSLNSSSSKPMASHGRFGSGLTGHGCHSPTAFSST